MISLKANFSCGDTIEDAFTEAIDLATRLNILIEFDFNNVVCLAWPSGDPESGIKQYHDQIGKPYAVASAR